MLKSPGNLNLTFFLILKNYLSCRHSTLAQHFGEMLKPCGSNCDFCKDPKKVGCMLNALTKEVYAKTANRKFDVNDIELYEGGKNGYFLVCLLKLIINLFFMIKYLDLLKRLNLIIQEQQKKLKHKVV